MNLDFTPSEEAFRQQVLDFLRTDLPADIAAKVAVDERLSREDMLRWHAILQSRGWLANHWPTAYGGPGWTATQRYIFEYESAMANAPRPIQFGINMLGPVLIKFGTEAQKAHYLPRILDGSDWWCQGYSEPGAGSDLASLKTTAELRGDRWVVNGQKTWTTLGQFANKMFCLVRSEKTERKQEGISFLLIDMDSPGIEVRPIITIDGEHEVNEVFLSDVEVPVDNLVGQPGHGWTCAKYLLGYERTGMAGVGYAYAALERLKHAAATVQRRGRPLLSHADFRKELSLLEIEACNLRVTNFRTLAAVESGGGSAAAASMLKIQGSRLRQAINALSLKAMGAYGPKVVNDLTDEAGLDLQGIGPQASSRASVTYLNNRKLSIFGGSNEIQKNIIAKTIGL
ncbi:acyl-CoA dehydrogenase family protein [Piscinibacter sakaiensis]|uniref:acyl-CoA dehydrogenase family protein n=1 Tax=Piscinibacter sakaiensis TaxID=1547922 RepID=UPI003AAC473F